MEKLKTIVLVLLVITVSFLLGMNNRLVQTQFSIREVNLSQSEEIAGLKLLTLQQSQDFETLLSMMRFTQTDDSTADYIVLGNGSCTPQESTYECDFFSGEELLCTLTVDVGGVDSRLEISTIAAKGPESTDVFQPIVIVHDKEGKIPDMLRIMPLAGPGACGANP